MAALMAGIGASRHFRSRKVTCRTRARQTTPDLGYFSAYMPRNHQEILELALGKQYQVAVDEPLLPLLIPGSSRNVLLPGLVRHLCQSDLRAIRDQRAWRFRRAYRTPEVGKRAAQDRRMMVKLRMCGSPRWLCRLPFRDASILNTNLGVDARTPTGFVASHQPEFGNSREITKESTGLFISLGITGQKRGMRFPNSQYGPPSSCRWAGVCKSVLDMRWEGGGRFPPSPKKERKRKENKKDKRKRGEKRIKNKSKEKERKKELRAFEAP